MHQQLEIEGQNLNGDNFETKSSSIWVDGGGNKNPLYLYIFTGTGNPARRCQLSFKYIKVFEFSFLILDGLNAVKLVEKVLEVTYNSHSL